jgi:hypothetical protein
LIIVGPSTGELEERKAIMGDSAPGQQPLDAQETAEDEANGEPEPEPDPQAAPASPPPADPANEMAPRSKFHG